MAIAKVKNGNREYFIELPTGELEVLLVLSSETPLVCLQISQKIRKSTADAYSQLERLRKKGFTTREDATEVVFGTTVKRVVWKRVFSEVITIPTITSLEKT